MSPTNLAYSTFWDIEGRTLEFRLFTLNTFGFFVCGVMGMEYRFRK